LGEDREKVRLVCHIDLPCSYAIIVDMAAARNFHVPLAESTYRELREIAEQLRRPATQLGREAIESWLKEARRASIAEAIQAYAEQAAGTTADLDEALENASIDYLGSTEGGLTEGRED
jgi:predicted transcriptional regulator